MADETPERRTIAVIDGNSLMHRAFHAIMQPMSAPDGTPTNALFGFFNMFIKLVETFKPDGVICAFDKGKPQVRMDMLPQYKAQRPPMDERLRPQFPLVKDLLRSLDVPVCELEAGKATTSWARSRAAARPPATTCTSSRATATCTSSPPRT